MKRFLSALITTCLWALAITQVLITRCLIPALQLLLMLLQDQAAATPAEPPVADANEPAAERPTGAQLKAEVLRLYAEGVTSASAIAKATGAARTSVRRWLNERQQEAAESAVACALMPIKAEAVATR